MILTAVKLCSNDDSHGMWKDGVHYAAMLEWGLCDLFCLYVSLEKLGGIMPRENKFWSELQVCTYGALGGVLQTMKRYK